MRGKHAREIDDDEFWLEILPLVRELLELGVKALQHYLYDSSLHLHIGETTMTDYQLNQGDSVIVTITDTDDVTGLFVTPDAGSVVADLLVNESSSTLVLDPSGTFLTLTAGPNEAVGDQLSVTASVGGVPSAAALGSFDVVAVVSPEGPTTLSISFGAETGDETPEATPVAEPVLTAPPADSTIAGVVFDEVTGNYKSAS